MPRNTANQLSVKLNDTMIATQWFDHGDHPYVARMNGSNWEYFPNESDEGCGLLSGLLLVQSGDWIIWSEIFHSFVVLKPQEFKSRFTPQEASATKENCPH